MVLYLHMGDAMANGLQLIPFDKAKAPVRLLAITLELLKAEQRIFATVAACAVVAVAACTTAGALGAMSWFIN